MRQTLDFIVIGAQKSGTTSVFEHLRKHPELYVAPEKDHPFFSHDDVYASGWSAFMWNAFRGAPTEARWGTVTVPYMMGCPIRGDDEGAGEHDPRERTERIIPERIHQQLPEVKLIAVLRDPVARCISHYGYDAFLGKADRRRFDETIHELLVPATLESSRRQGAPGYVAWGEYGRILKAYYDVFRREQILVGFTRHLEASPREFMRELFAYLGVDPGFVPADLETRHLRGAGSRRIRWLPDPAQLERRLAGQRWARALWRSLSTAAQTRALLLSRRANYRVRLWNAGGSAFSREEASTETLDLLRAHYEKDRVLLEELIGKPVPWGTRATAPMPFGPPAS
jgi:hypothetical protein